jgi:hypothetical protein
MENGLKLMEGCVLACSILGILGEGQHRQRFRGGKGACVDLCNGTDLALPLVSTWSWARALTLGSPCLHPSDGAENCICLVGQ